MKTLFLLPIVALLLFTSCSSNNSDFSSALDYNNYIVEQQAKIIRPMIQVMDSDDPAEMKIKLGELQKIINENLDEVKPKKAYSGGEELKRTYIELAMFYSETVKTDYVEMIDILAEILDGDMSNYARLEELSGIVGEKEIPFDNAFQMAQEKFASANNLSITDNSLQNEIDAMQ